jgi:hypothetical protein
MAEGDSNTAITQWLKDKGYSDADVQKILAKLAERDHQTMSDAVFDSIGGDGQTLDQIIREALEG